MINIENLHFAYKKKKVFDGLSLSLQPGHIYGLLGRNGTGKSTLLRNIAGLLFPLQGQVEVLGYKPSKRQPAFLQDLFMVPEEFYLPNVSIEKFIKCNALFYPKFNREQFDRYLKEFDIPASNKLQQMSYGQKKKVLIGFGLACNTSIVLMDEPTNGLDILSKSRFRKIMASALDENKCILISTHQVKDLENLIDHITIIDEGKILLDEDVEQITSKLNFKISFDSNEIKNALYNETSLQGDAIVTPNLNKEEGKLDLEMLYKAVILNGESITALFKN
jgi:ABC-2 type transport system ATP-binding protein